MGFMISVKLPTQSSVITVMTKAAIKASRGLLRDFSELENLQVSVKNNRAFVTSADLKADKILKDELQHARPTYSLTSEESEEIVGEDPSYRWIVDPLDGTVNYMHGFPHWAISIALQKDGEFIAAVTYDPIKNEMFWAEKGCGAYVNDKKIRVSGKRTMSDLLISVCSLDQVAGKKVFTLANRFRRTGSVTLDMAYVAAGRMDLLLSSADPNIWDVAAGILLVREAGGVAAAKNGKAIASYEEMAILGNVNIIQSASDICFS
ncbi:inositol monophosphatase [Alphaproteobacteria bacterium]|nr:inositol monophosphatase [Alphaproteobacteria bacterium]